jgi:hypothetical protein
MLIPFGVLSAAGAGGVEGDYELIATEILGSSQSSITFSNLGDYSSTYKHLQIRMVTKSDRSDNNLDNPYIQFNGDTGNNYTWHFLEGNGSSVSSGGFGNFNSTLANGIYPSTLGANTTSAFSGNVIDILDAYSSTKNKTIRSLSGGTNASNFIRLTSGFWLNTNALTSIVIKINVGPNFVAGSRFSIYGIKG